MAEAEMRETTTRAIRDQTRIQASQKHTRDAR
jgi:hypothetical protein